MTEHSPIPVKTPLSPILHDPEDALDEGLEKSDFGRIVGENRSVTTQRSQISQTLQYVNEQREIHFSLSCAERETPRRIHGSSARFSYGSRTDLQTDGGINSSIDS